VIATVDQNREELIVRPTSNEITGPKSILHGLSNYVQHCIACGRTVGGSKVRQAIYLNEDDAEGKVVAREAREILPQVELGELVIGDAGGFVHAAMRRQSVAIAVPLGGKVLFVKTLRDSDDRAVRVAQGSNPHQHMNRMSFFMAQLHFCFLRLALVQGPANGTRSAASDTTLIVTPHQNIVAAGASHDLMPLVPGEPFGTLVPE
jgi:hypothetical protein